jgi:hypothetical protein
MVVVAIVIAGCVLVSVPCVAGVVVLSVGVGAVELVGGAVLMSDVEADAVVEEVVLVASERVLVEAMSVELDVAVVEEDTVLELP